MDSTGDNRILNNVMRHEYRVLSEQEKKAMQAIKDEGLEFWNLIDQLANIYPASGREMALAKTKIEEAVLWSIKGLTK